MINTIFRIQFIIITIIIFSNCKINQTNISDNQLSGIIFNRILDQHIYSGSEISIPLIIFCPKDDSLNVSLICQDENVKLKRVFRGKYKIDFLSERLTKEKKINVKLSFKLNGKEEFYNFKIHLLPSPNFSIKEFADGNSLNFINPSSIHPENMDMNEGAELYFLKSGKYGKITLEGVHNKIFVSSNKDVVIDFLELKNCNNVSFNGISFGNYKSEKESTIVTIDSSTRNVEFMNCIFRTIDSVENMSIDDWKTRIASGVISYGQRVNFINNTFFNVFHALEINGDSCLVNGNIIYSFSGDGIRNTGSSNTFFSNCIFNATVDDYYEPGGNHDDLFQSWTFGKPIRNIVVKNNICISCLDENLKHKSKIVQGIVCFDGFEDNWLISNNLVITDHPHGIALFGAENCIIENNNVIRNPLKIADFESNPWIMISSHKDGRTSLNNTVKNNYSHTYRLSGSIIDSTGNKLIENTNIFEDYNNWNFKIIKKPPRH